MWSGQRPAQAWSAELTKKVYNPSSERASERVKFPPTPITRSLLSHSRVKKDSMQNINEMRRILEAVDKGRDDIDCLVSGDRENIWRYWIRPTLIASDPAKKRKG